MINDRTFDGYLRPDGSVGCRNYIAVIPNVFCANETVLAIAEADPSLCRPLLHHCGCGMLKDDLLLAENTLISLANNPNVASVILVGLGCEAASQKRVYEGIVHSGKPVANLTIHKESNFLTTVEKGKDIVHCMAEEIRAAKRQQFPVSKIKLAVKCGSSDATSGIAANLATGKVVDWLIDHGATVAFGETTEFIGAEHILCKRGITETVRRRIIEVSQEMEDRIKATGLDMRGTQPSRGNIAGGLTTIEEKSLGAISKSGHRPINGVSEFAQPVKGPGLFIINAPGKEDVFLTAACAAGANVIIFTTGGGAPQGCPLVPVVKVASNPAKVCMMRPHIDVDVSSVFTGEKNLNDIWPLILSRILKTLNGDKVAAEVLGYDKTIGIPTKGPLI